MTEEESLFDEGEQQVRREVAETPMIPVINDQQLGQDILRTFARVSDPPMVEIIKIRRKVPVFRTKTILGANGSEKEVEYIEKWEVKEWEEPIRIQPKYHELITDDVSRAFLSDEDLSVWRAVASYCKMVKSFCERYDLDLSINHNNFADENYLLLVSSGAYKGKRVQLAKTNIAETSYRASTTQLLQQEPRKKKGFINELMP